MAGAILSALRCCFACGRRKTFCTSMLFRSTSYLLAKVAGALLSALRCCFAWQALYSLHSDAVSRGRRCTLYHLAQAGRCGPPWAGGLLAWQAQYFLHSDAVSHGNRSALCTLMLFCVAGAALYTTLRLANVGRRGPAVFLQAHYFLRSDAVSRGRSSTLCTPMLLRVAGAVLYITLRRLAAVGRRGPAVFLRDRRNTVCTLMLFRVAGAVLSAL